MIRLPYAALASECVTWTIVVPPWLSLVKSGGNTAGYGAVDRVPGRRPVDSDNSNAVADIG